MCIRDRDNTRGKIKLISLMRDSLVSIDGYGETKLNEAYFYGGPSLAIRTINESFGTDITDYIAVNFNQLVEIINAMEGVEIDVQDYDCLLYTSGYELHHHLFRRRGLGAAVVRAHLEHVFDRLFIPTLVQRKIHEARAGDLHRDVYKRQLRGGTDRPGHGGHAV